MISYMSVIQTKSVSLIVSEIYGLNAYHALSIGVSELCREKYKFDRQSIKRLLGLWTHYVCVKYQIRAVKHG